MSDRHGLKQGLRVNGYTALAIDDEAAILRRAADCTPLLLSDAVCSDAVCSDADCSNADGSEPRINDSHWSQWKEIVLQANLGGYTLGRCTASLNQLPKRLWELKLDEFARDSLRGLRRRRAIGAKKPAP